ncbi:hypothetical protein [Rhizobium alvei]|uniref:DUF2163 domain-containing protein n=1 Tax=Rhizobium alvei TaxID=1132659 RepID=A0ABT8YUR4_9HYPH|nr:hypothetical protein [Rhizobium alvei]MDO6966998.1 hypothetical protein [Rhizobium alvei]
MIRSLRILCEIQFPGQTVRLWDGSGRPFMDADGNIWRAARLNEEAIDQIESAINAESFTVAFTISGIDSAIFSTVWADYQAGTIVGSRVRFLIQPLDDFEQPVGDPDICFTGGIDNFSFDETAADDGKQFTISVEVTNRFALIARPSGSVLSDADQKARSAVINPGANPDRSCERIPGLVDKSIRWPVW